MLTQLNSFADNLIATIQAEIRWFAGMKKIFVPFIFMVAAIAGIGKFALDFFEQHSTAESSFFLNLLVLAASYLLFNLLICPALIIINLWLMNLLKQEEEGRPVRLRSALLSSIGFKLFKLIPFVFVWMFFQSVFIFFFVLIALLAGLSRGSAGRGAIGKLIGGIMSASILVQLLLFVVTPGMVFDNLGIFSSFRRMRGYLNAHYQKANEKFFHYLIPMVMLAYAAGILPAKIAALHAAFPYYTLYVTGVIASFFVFLIQVKAGQFYLWSKNHSGQNVFSGQAVASQPI